MATIQYFKEDSDEDRIVPLFSEQIRALNGEHVTTQSAKLNDRLAAIVERFRPNKPDPPSHHGSGSYPEPPRPRSNHLPASPSGGSDSGILQSDPCTKRTRVTLGLPPRSKTRNDGTCCDKQQPRKVDRSWEAEPPSITSVWHCFHCQHALVSGR